MSPHQFRQRLPAGYTATFDNGHAIVTTPDGQTSQPLKPLSSGLNWAHQHAKDHFEDTAMTPIQLREQLPAGYTAAFQDGHAFIHTPNGYRSQPFHPWEGALDWAQQHDKEACADAVARLPAGFGISSFDLELGGYRLLHPKATYLPECFITRGVAADGALKIAETLDQIPKGYRVEGKITGSLIAWTVILADKKHLTTSYSLEGAMFAARGHAAQQEKGEEILVPRGTVFIDAHNRKLADGRTVPERWGILPSKRAREANTLDGWNVFAPHEVGPVKVIDRDEPREWPTPEAALDYILTQADPTPTPDQFREIRSRITAPSKTSQTEINQIAMILPPGVTATGQLQWGTSANDPITLWRLQRQSDGVMMPWHNTETLTQISDVSLLFVVDQNELPPTPEDTAMTHPAHQGPALREIEKMISLLEHGEWADTFPTYAQGQRLEAVINNMIGLQRKSDEAGHRMAEQLEQERSRQETNPGLIKQLTEVSGMLYDRDMEGLEGYEATFSASTSLRVTAMAVLQERNDANSLLTRISEGEPHNWALATYELDALLAAGREGEAEVKDCEATTPVSKPWKDLLIELMHAARTSTAVRDSSQASFDELMALRDLFKSQDLAGLEAYDTQFAIGATWQDACCHALRTLQMPNPELPLAFKSAAVELAMAVLDNGGDRVPYAYRVIRLAAGTPAPEHKL